MKYFLLAGEPSGDLHAASLIEALHLQDAQAQFFGLGGDRMQAAGMTLFQHYRHMAYMGILSVVLHLNDVRRNFRIAKNKLLEVQPDVLILIDYPSFNLRIAAFAKKHLPNTKIVYYIPPKVWAWKTRRIHRIAALCDEVLGIFPFEPAFYARYGYHCTYVGNPTVSELSNTKPAKPAKPAKQPQGRAKPTTIVLLPGSRESEITRCLPVMLAAARKVCNLQQPKGRTTCNLQPATAQRACNLPPATCNLTICAAPSIPDAVYEKYLQAGETLTRDTYNALTRARVAIVNSGTATLETALIGCPQLAVYRIVTSRWLGWLRPFLFKIPYFTLVNLIANDEVIYEAIGPRFTQSNIERELHRLLTDESARERMQAQYARIRDILGSQSAPTTAAAIISIALQWTGQNNANCGV